MAYKSWHIDNEEGNGVSNKAEPSTKEKRHDIEPLWNSSDRHRIDKAIRYSCRMHNRESTRDIRIHIHSAHGHKDVRHGGFPPN